MPTPVINTSILISTIAAIIFNFVFVSISYTQVHPCGTDLLNNNKNDPERPILHSDHVTTRSSYSLPVAIHIINNYSSFNSSFHACKSTIETQLAQDDLAAANEFFKPHDIEFFICGEINYIRSGKLNAINTDSDAERNQLNAHNIENVINIYYVNSIYSEHWSIAGYAYFPWWSSNRHIVMSRRSLHIGSTLAHELGHALGLYHPHSTSFGSELVDGSNCHETGDLICDTPADPNLYGKVNNDCQYNQFERDSIGTLYAPNTRLIMSYSRKSCRTLFSPQQVDRMKEVCEQYYKDYVCNPPTQEIQVAIYPNPASDRVHIGIIDDVEMEIFDANGRLHRPVPISERCLDISTLNNGVYFIRIKKLDAKESEIFKFIVEH